MATLYSKIGTWKNSDDLVLSNMRLVVHLAKKYQGMGLSLEDLIQEGTIGICIAKEKWNPKLGKFPSYAGLWITAMIRQALNNKSRTVRVPVHRITKEEKVHVQEFDPKFSGSYIDNIERYGEEQDQFNKLQKLLGYLKPKQRQCIELKWGIGCEPHKVSEISKKLGLTPQAINGHIRNGIQIMKEKESV